MNWNEAIATARNYHRRIQVARWRDHDEDEDNRLHDEYETMPAIVKDALSYLCEAGEID